MTTANVPTLPKPFVFVLMPFDPDFDDIYKFGIKGAADDVGAHVFEAADIVGGRFETDKYLAEKIAETVRRAWLTHHRHSPRKNRN